MHILKYTYALCVVSCSLWAMEALKNQQDQIAQQQRNVATVKNNPAFSLNNTGLEKVMRTIFTIIQNNMPDDMKYRSNVEKIRTPLGKQRICHEAIQKAMDSVDLSPALQNPTENDIITFTQQLDRILHRAFTELNVLPSESALGWCTCDNAPFPLRIALIMRVLNDACRERKPDERLVYTSIAAGTLLLDYLIISELIHYGFKEIQVNFIEPEILDLSEIDLLAGKDTDNSASSAAHIAFIDALDASMHLSTFKEKISALPNNRSIVTIDSYKHEAAYIQRAQKYPYEKTDILMLVDAAGFLYAVKDLFDAQAFVITPYENKSTWNARALQFIVFLPSSGPQNITIYSNIEFSTELATKLAMKEIYTQVLETIRNINPKSSHYVSDILRNVKDIVTPKMNKEGVIESKNRFYVQWVSEASLVLQNITRQAMAPSGTVYEIYSSQLQRLDLEMCKTADLITSRTGTDLLNRDLKYRKMPSPLATLTSSE